MNQTGRKIFSIGFCMMHLTLFGQGQDVIQTKAFSVLEAKCNACHIIDYPKSVFKYSNMNGFAKKIYKQVFVKENMPKGDSIHLTDKERAILILWLRTQLTIDDN